MSIHRHGKSAAIRPHHFSFARNRITCSTSVVLYFICVTRSIYLFVIYIYLCSSIRFIIGAIIICRCIMFNVLVSFEMHLSSNAYDFASASSSKPPWETVRCVLKLCFKIRVMSFHVIPVPRDMISIFATDFGQFDFADGLSTGLFERLLSTVDENTGDSEIIPHATFLQADYDITMLCIASFHLPCL